MKRKVLMLGGGPLQTPAIQKIKQLGYTVICIDYDEKAEGFQYADSFEIVSTMDFESVLQIAKDESVDFVITSTSDAPVRTAAYVSEKLGLPTGISYEDAIAATHKDMMRNRLCQNDVPIPIFIACANELEFNSAVHNLDFNCIVKPADSAASRGVVLVDQFLSTGEIRDLYKSVLIHSKKNVVMVEERLIGPEISVEAITVNNKTRILSLTDKLITSPPYFVELGHSEPSCLSKKTQDEICNLVYRTIAAIGLEYGPSHTEIIVTENGPKVIEIATRLGGDYITSRLVPLSTGIDFVAGSVAVSLGLPFDFTPSEQRGSAIRFITASSPGTIDKIIISDEIKDIPEVKEICIYSSEGDYIDTPHSSNDRIGHIVCVGDDAQKAVQLADYILGKIEVSIVE